MFSAYVTLHVCPLVGLLHFQFQFSPICVKIYSDGFTTNTTHTSRQVCSDWFKIRCETKMSVFCGVFSFWMLQTHKWQLYIFLISTKNHIEENITTGSWLIHYDQILRIIDICFRIYLDTDLLEYIGTKPILYAMKRLAFKVGFHI